MHTTPSIADSKIQNVLERLHQASKSDTPKVLKALGKGIFKKIKPDDVSTAYLSVSREQGLYMYNTIISEGYQNIVEFGTSFGISTLYLAAAAQLQCGRVITSEIVPEKCNQARRHFQEAGLDKIIDLREGDALETLKDINHRIDFLLLDGWKDLYDPIFEMLEDKFHERSRILVDNTNFPAVRKFLKKVEKNEAYLIEKIPVDKGNTALITVA